MSHSPVSIEPSAAIVHRLLEIHDGVVQFLPLTLDDIWQEMLREELIRVCPYPEEDVVLLPKGRTVIALVIASSHGDQCQVEASLA